MRGDDPYADVDETVRGLRALAEPRSHGDSRLLLQVADATENLRNAVAKLDTRQAVLEEKQRNAPSTKDMALIAQNEQKVLVADVRRIDKFLTGTMVAVGIEVVKALLEWVLHK